MMTKEEEKFVQYRRGVTETFDSLLIKAIMVADSDNRALLEKSFPELVGVIKRVREEYGYWEGLVERWNQKYPPLKQKI